MKPKVMKGSHSWLSMSALVTPAKDFDRNLALQKATITAYKINSSRTSAQQISANSQITSLFLLMTLFKDCCLTIFYILQLNFVF